MVILFTGLRSCELNFHRLGVRLSSIVTALEANLIDKKTISQKWTYDLEALPRPHNNNQTGVQIIGVVHVVQRRHHAITLCGELA